MVQRITLTQKFTSAWRQPVSYKLSLHTKCGSLLAVLCLTYSIIGNFFSRGSTTFSLIYMRQKFSGQACD